MSSSQRARRKRTRIILGGQECYQEDACANVDEFYALGKPEVRQQQPYEEVCAFWPSPERA